jgi:hypothetical protein
LQQTGFAPRISPTFVGTLFGAKQRKPTPHRKPFAAVILGTELSNALPLSYAGFAGGRNRTGDEWVIDVIRACTTPQTFLNRRTPPTFPQNLLSIRRKSR